MSMSGICGPARVEEPLEEQVVADRVDVDDVQAVRDARPGRAAPPRADPDGALAGVAEQVPDDQEVRREAHRLDDAELVLEALHDVGRDRVAVAFRGAGERQLAQVRVLVVTGGGREGRQDGVAELDLDVGPLRDQQRVVARLFVVGEQAPHLGGRLQVELLAVELQPLGVVGRRRGLDAQQRVVGLGVLARACSGCRWWRAAGSPGRRRCATSDGLTRAWSARPWSCSSMKNCSRPRMSWNRPASSRAPVSSPREEPLAHRAAEAAARGDDPLAVAARGLEVDAGLVEEPVEVRERRELHQVAVAGVRSPRAG